MVGDIVLALIIFYWIIPAAFAGLAWLVVQTFYHPMRVLVGAILVGCMISAMMNH